MPLGRSTLLATVAALAAAAAGARVAAAEPVVLAVDGTDVYIDLGARDGVGAGTELELLHEVTVKDPRTGQTLRDHFSLGTLTVTRSGDRASVARAPAELGKRVLAGDRVRLVSAARRFVDPWAERAAAAGRRGARARPGTPPAAGAPSPAAIAEAEHARVAWEQTLGRPPEERVRRWLDYLRAHPRSPYAAAVQREIATLRRQAEEREEALARARSADADDRIPRLARLVAALPAPMTTAADGAAVRDVGPLLVASPGEALAGKPLGLAFVVREPHRVARAWLYARGPGDPGFRRVELVRDGDTYLRGTIDAALVRAPRVRWYVEIAGADGQPEPALGSQAEPREIEVERSIAEAPIARGRSHIDAHFDYVDFDGKLGGGYDQYYLAEFDFTYRFLDPIHAVRLGFGTLSGTGGPKDIIDEDPQGRCLDASGVYRCAQVAFTYVYTELEHRLRPNVAIMIRPQAGMLSTDRMQGGASGRCSTRDVAGCEFLTGWGMRGRLRLGDELGTNLVVGAAFTSNVGTLLEASYNWLPAPVVPIQLGVQVTDLPNRENFGVRLIADVGWRRLPWFYPSARVSYQARDIDHAGVSGGMALNFDW